MLRHGVPARFASAIAQSRRSGQRRQPRCKNWAAAAPPDEVCSGRPLLSESSGWRPALDACACSWLCGSRRTATIPSALGILFTPWLFDPALILSGAITMLAIVYVWALFHRGAVNAHPLIAASGFYALFALGLALWVG